MPDSTTSLRAEQIARWQAGDRVLLEPLLASRPALLEQPDALLDLIYAEVLLREEHGDRPTAEEYVGRFPAHEPALRRQFVLHDALGALETDRAALATIPFSPPSQRSVGLTEIGPYTILGEIGRGAMGIVYAGRHRTLSSRLAAIKVLQTGEGDEEERRRFLTEARTVAALDHPNIVRIYEVFDPPPGEGPPFVALEHVAGGTLAGKINGAPLLPREAADLLLPLAEAMQYAHQAGVIHRDLKPANILLHSGIPKVTDFGLARRLAEASRTRSGAVLGTPSYMAPEQAHGRTDVVGPAADVYGLGAILYEALTGRPPFRSDTVLNTLAQVVAEEPVPPRRRQPSVPRDLEIVCLKCLQKTPGRRYASAGELAADLRRFQNGQPILARPVGMVERGLKWLRRRPAAAALLGVGVCALAALVALWASFTLRLDEQKRAAIEQRDEARTQRNIARARSEEAERQSKRARHLLELSATAVDEIAINVRSGKIGEASSGNTGEVLFKLSCFYAKASNTLRQDRDLPLADRDKLAEQYAVSAVRLLGCAERVGFFARDRPANRAVLHNSPDLAALRDRPEYRQFLSRLP